MPSRILPAFAALLGAVSLAACSSSSGGSGSGAGSAIKIAAIGSFQSTVADFTDGADAMRAKVAQVNAAGGIHGHQIELTVCDDKSSPNEAATCARNAVSDHVVAVMSPTSFSGFGAQMLPILQAAGIPDVGQPATTPTDWTSPNSFPLDPGQAAQYDGVALALKKAGCTNVGSLQVPVPAAVEVVKDLQQALPTIGSKLVLNIQVGMTESSYAPQVARLTSAGAQCIVPIMGGSEMIKLISAIEQSGAHLTLGGVTAAFGQETLTSLGSKAQGIVLSGAAYLPTDTSVKGVQDMLAAMKKYTPGTKATTNAATQSWGTATLLINGVLPSIKGDITPDSVMKALEATKNAPTGTYAPYTFDQAPPNPNFPRLRNTGILTWTVGADAVPKLDSSHFLNIFQAMKNGS